MFANNYGWSKEYILDYVTFPQSKLYLESFGKRIEYMFSLFFGNTSGSLNARTNIADAVSGKKKSVLNMANANMLGLSGTTVKEVDSGKDSKVKS